MNPTKKYATGPMSDKNNRPFNTIESFIGLDSLVYESDVNWIPFPAWARYYIELGAALSNYEQAGCNFVTAITVPSRAFAASLITSGIVVKRVNISSKTNESYVQKIESLPINTPVIFRTSKRQYKGIFKGVITCGEKRYFQILYQEGNNTERSIPEESINKIEVMDREDWSLPKNQSGRELVPPSPLLKRLLDEKSLYKVMMESRLECVILGQINSFRQELLDFNIGYRLNDETVDSGKLIELTRPRGNQFQPSSVTHRTYIFPSSSKYNTPISSKLDNYVTVFDSCLGFIKWRSSFRKSNWIVILDRTDRNYDSALKEINDDYYQKRLDKRYKLSLPNPPPGVELMFFEVKL